MKRVLSWVVLILISGLIGLLTTLVACAGDFLLDIVHELPAFFKLIAYLLGGTTFLSFLLMPAYYGTSITISASEAVKKSKSGLRYIVFSSLMLIGSIIEIIFEIQQNGSFRISLISMCIYYIFLFYIGKSTPKNNRVFS